MGRSLSRKGRTVCRFQNHASAKAWISLLVRNIFHGHQSGVAHSLTPGRRASVQPPP